MENARTKRPRPPVDMSRIAGNMNFPHEHRDMENGKCFSQKFLEAYHQKSFLDQLGRSRKQQSQLQHELNMQQQFKENQLLENESANEVDH
ncbi:hypothetical protein L1987_32405 [Smallanthus sonchifolius]|uniref:Uncharacterized protein n=1 Tax=Smallanthus sonchifolius TaxID=185202 RepID=A0ACB9HMW8_9ASTR|nr:hypothetical protein L1987_32405 [Smallanthus sonchifolius]